MNFLFLNLLGSLGLGNGLLLVSGYSGCLLSYRSLCLCLSLGLSLSLCLSFSLCLSLSLSLCLSLSVISSHGSCLLGNRCLLGGGLFWLLLNLSLCGGGLSGLDLSCLSLGCGLSLCHHFRSNVYLLSGSFLGCLDLLVGSWSFLGLSFRLLCEGFELRQINRLCLELALRA